MKFNDILKMLPNNQAVKLYNRRDEEITLFEIKNSKPYPLNGVTTDKIEKCNNMRVVRVGSTLYTTNPDEPTQKVLSNRINLSIPVKSIIEIVVESCDNTVGYNNKYGCFVVETILSDIEIDEVFIFRNCKFRKISDEIFTSIHDIEHSSPNCLNLENKHRVSLMNNCSVSKIINTEV
jgi:hypothetical protein